MYFNFNQSDIFTSKVRYVMKSRTQLINFRNSNIKKNIFSTQEDNSLLQRAVLISGYEAEMRLKSCL